MATTTMVRMMQSTAAASQGSLLTVARGRALAGRRARVDHLDRSSSWEPVLRNAAILEHQNSVHAAHQPELVRYDEGSAAFG